MLASELNEENHFICGGKIWKFCRHKDNNVLAEEVETKECMIISRNLTVEKVEVTDDTTTISLNGVSRSNEEPRSIDSEWCRYCHNQRSDNGRLQPVPRSC